jgi:hypothetical protein
MQTITEETTMEIQNTDSVHKTTSNWNYTIPVTAATLWAISGASGAAHVCYLILNEDDSDALEATLNTAKIAACIAGATIPVAAVASFSKAMYYGSCKVLKDCFNFYKSTKPEAIFANTIIAPAAVLAIPYMMLAHG